MIAVGFRGVKARKPQHWYDFAENCHANIFGAFCTVCTERNCTILASCVKFTTNKSLRGKTVKLKYVKTVSLPDKKTY